MATNVKMKQAIIMTDRDNAVSKVLLPMSTTLGFCYVEQCTVFEPTFWPYVRSQESATHVRHDAKLMLFCTSSSWHVFPWSQVVISTVRRLYTLCSWPKGYNRCNLLPTHNIICMHWRYIYIYQTFREFFLSFSSRVPSYLYIMQQYNAFAI